MFYVSIWIIHPLDEMPNLLFCSLWSVMSFLVFVSVKAELCNAESTFDNCWFVIHSSMHLPGVQFITFLESGDSHTSALISRLVRQEQHFRVLKLRSSMQESFRTIDFTEEEWPQRGCHFFRIISGGVSCYGTALEVLLKICGIANKEVTIGWYYQDSHRY